MDAEHGFFQPAHFLQQTPEERQRLLDLAARSLSPDFLLQYQELVFRYIDQQYPDNPGSLFNRDHHYGRRMKHKFKREMDQALGSQVQQVVDFTLKAQRVTLEAQLDGIDAAFHDQQRGLRKQRHSDQLEVRVQTSRASDKELQSELVRLRLQHDQQRELEAWRHEHAMAMRQLEADIDVAKREFERPHELHMKLYDVWADLSRYGMALHDRANRNPALADRLRTMAVGLNAVMSQVQNIITQLNVSGPLQPTPDQLREQTMAILNLAMDQMQQWNDMTRNETID